MATARWARAPVAHTSSSGTPLFLTAPVSFSSSWFRGTFLAPIMWPVANSSGSRTSTSTARSRLMRCTAPWAVSVPPPAPRTSGQASMPPELSAIRISIQFAVTNSINFTGVPWMANPGF